MKTYKTAQVARIIGIHPNTVRSYETWGLIPPARRLPNGYRVFTELHIRQFQLARLALRIEVLQNGLRKKIVEMVKLSAAGDFDGAMGLTRDYLSQLCWERKHAEEAIELVRQIISGESQEPPRELTRKEAALLLGLTTDTIRNWEMNGLLPVRRGKRGCPVYTGAELCRLKIIRSLRCANYSLESILRLLLQLSANPDTDIEAALNTPRAGEELISVCDKLILSLQEAGRNALRLLEMLREMKQTFG